MRYRLKKKYSTNPDTALREILQDRGVEDLEHFMNPGPECALSPYNLNNIGASA